MVRSVTRQSANNLSCVLPLEPGAEGTAARANGAETYLETNLEANRISLLTEVDFKWLMAGQGWHVDTMRFQSDLVYANNMLTLALESDCPALRDCATHILEASPIIQP